MSNLTVAGVISTGTHGSGAAYGIMSSYVRVGTGSDFCEVTCRGFDFDFVFVLFSQFFIFI